MNQFPQTPQQELLDIVQTIELGLSRGYTPAALLDENSPVRDRIRAVLAAMPASDEALPIDVQAELAELREATRMTPDHAALAKFYGVTTYAGLVARQAHHIERLQAKLPPTPSLAPQRVREG